MKIRKNIERTNRITRIVNRWRNGSECMYDEENFRTDEAMRKIVEAKISEGGSRRIETFSWYEEMERRVHSTNTEDGLRSMRIVAVSEGIRRKSMMFGVMKDGVNMV